MTKKENSPGNTPGSFINWLRLMLRGGATTNVYDPRLAAPTNIDMNKKEDIMSFDYYDKLNKDVPEILPGDVIKVSSDNDTRKSFWLVVRPDYLLGIKYNKDRGKAELVAAWNLDSLKHQSEVIKVCRQNGGFNHFDLARIASDEFVPTIYSKTDVKEFTVDEISELLGYKVKVVGNNN